MYTESLKQNLLETKSNNMLATGYEEEEETISAEEFRDTLKKMLAQYYEKITPLNTPNGFSIG